MRWCGGARGSAWERRLGGADARSGRRKKDARRTRQLLLRARAPEALQ
jgi:hypothetical protein